MECLICYDESRHKFFTCTHRLCKRCALNYLEQKLTAGDTNIACPGLGCLGSLSKAELKNMFLEDTDEVKNEAEINNILSQHPLYIQYQEIVLDNLAPQTPHLPVSGLVELFSQSEGVDASQCSMATATDFYHYDCLGEHDRGWGCAYRAVQSIVSNLLARDPLAFQILQHQPHGVPLLLDIQRELVAAGRFQPADIGSHKWMEPPDGCAYLRHHGVVASHTRLASQQAGFWDQLDTMLWQHFQSLATPVMIDDSIYAYTLVGICKMVGEEESYVLRFDPHVRIDVGQTYDDFVNQKGVGVQWMKLSTLFKNRQWMFLFPLSDRYD